MESSHNHSSDPMNKSTGLPVEYSCTSFDLSIETLVEGGKVVKTEKKSV